MEGRVLHRSRRGAYEDIGFVGPASINLVIPELEAVATGWAKSSFAGVGPPEERAVWHFAEFEVID